jgi:preprotein translocase subunit YajC
MEIVLMLLVMVVCFVFGWTAREKAAERRIDRLMESVQVDIKEKIE